MLGAKTGRGVGACGEWGDRWIVLWTRGGHDETVYSRAVGAQVSDNTAGWLVVTSTLVIYW